MTLLDLRPTRNGNAYAERALNTGARGGHLDLVVRRMVRMAVTIPSNTDRLCQCPAERSRALL
jgi:hypothetical protein